MHVIHARNVNDALPRGRILLQRGVTLPSRYGEVVEMEKPVTTHYSHPAERVLFDPVRDANPFFHLMEALWILGGRADVAFLARFNKRMVEFSDNGWRFHGPYGERLRRWKRQRTTQTGWDQLERAVQMLKEDPGSRRIVCSIWDPDLDLGTDSKDIPCNDTIKFEARHGALNLIVFCRSNDMVWGAYGANIVQFSMIQQYVAEMAGLPLGWYEQISCNYHGYTATLPKAQGILSPCLYQLGEVAPRRLVDDPQTFDRDLREFLGLVDQDRPMEELLEGGFWPFPGPETFFTDVALPVYLAWRFYKQGETGAAFEALDGCLATDWERACRDWIRRHAR